MIEKQNKRKFGGLMGNELPILHFLVDERG